MFVTGKDKLSEMYDQDDSHPPSEESSARQTPQPVYNSNKDVQNMCNKSIALLAGQEKFEELEHQHLPILDQHIDPQSSYQNSASRIDIQNSKLQVS